jgi:hypothetical protein
MTPQRRMFLTRIKRSKDKSVKQLNLFSSEVQTQCIIKEDKPDHQERNCQFLKNIKTVTLRTNKEVVQGKVLEAKALQSQMFSKVNLLINLALTQ